MFGPSQMMSLRLQWYLNYSYLSYSVSTSCCCRRQIELITIFQGFWNSFKWWCSYPFETCLQLDYQARKQITGWCVIILWNFCLKKKEEIYSTKHPLMNNHGISSHCSNYYVLNLISLYATLAPKDIIQRHTWLMRYFFLSSLSLVYSTSYPFKSLLNKQNEEKYL